MKKAFLAAVAALALPAGVQAQSMFTPGASNPGVYLGVEGGGNWLLNSGNYNMDIGYAVGGVVGYDFVGPRVELEGVFRSNPYRYVGRRSLQHGAVAASYEHGQGRAGA